MIFTWFLHGCKFSIFPVSSPQDVQRLYTQAAWEVQGSTDQLQG